MPGKGTGQIALTFAMCVMVACRSDRDDGTAGSGAQGSSSGGSTGSGGAPSGNCALGDNPVVTQADLVAIANCTHFPGDLILNHITVPAISLPMLTEVAGVLRISHGQQLTQIDLPMLRSVGGGLFVSNNAALPNIGLPALESIGGTLEINVNDALNDLELPALSTVGEYFVVLGNPMLPTCEATAVRDQITALDANIDSNLGSCP